MAEIGAGELVFFTHDCLRHDATQWFKNVVECNTPALVVREIPDDCYPTAAALLHPDKRFFEVLVDNVFIVANESELRKR